MRDRITWFLLVVVAVGIVTSGWFVGQGLIHARTGDRFVTLKGLSEQIVKTDLAVWPVRFVATGNDLSAVQSKITSDANIVHNFLTEAGIPAAEIEVQSLEVTDLQAEAYRQGPIESRFIIAQTLMIRSEDVDQIASASQRISKLVDAGVVLGGRAGPGDSGPFYLFTRLTELKPEMIAEATTNARAAAEQFAADSGSQLGGIRQANQGVFQILPRDKVPGMPEEKQIHKTIRVVSTLEYFLID